MAPDFIITLGVVVIVLVIYIAFTEIIGRGRRKKIAQHLLAIDSLFRAYGHLPNESLQMFLHRKKEELLAEKRKNEELRKHAAYDADEVSICVIEVVRQSLPRFLGPDSPAMRNEPALFEELRYKLKGILSREKARQVLDEYLRERDAKRGIERVADDILEMVQIRQQLMARAALCDELAEALKEASALEEAILSTCLTTNSEDHLRVQRHQQLLAKHAALAQKGQET